MRIPNKLAKISELILLHVDSYRDFLKKEIDINRLMLYREEYLPSRDSACLHNENLLSKIKQLEIELSDLEDQLAA